MELSDTERKTVDLCRGADPRDDWNGYYVLDLVSIIDRLLQEGSSELVAWQWRYEGDSNWNTPSGGKKITDNELMAHARLYSRKIEQRPLYAAAAIANKG